MSFDPDRRLRRDLKKRLHAFLFKQPIKAVGYQNDGKIKIWVRNGGSLFLRISLCSRKLGSEKPWTSTSEKFQFSMYHGEILNSLHWLHCQ